MTVKNLTVVLSNFWQDMITRWIKDIPFDVVD